MATFRTMRTLATSMIVGRILYALPLWGNLPMYLQARLQSSLLSAARACLGPRHARDSTSQLLGALGWLSYPQMLEHSSSRLIHQILAPQVPASLYAKMPPPAPANTRAATSMSMMLPRRRRMGARQSLLYRGLEAYNQYGIDLKRVGRAKLFSKRLKTFLHGTRPARVPGYHLTILHQPPSFPEDRGDIQFILQPNGSSARVVVKRMHKRIKRKNGE